MRFSFLFLVTWNNIKFFNAFCETCFQIMLIGTIFQTNVVCGGFVRKSVFDRGRVDYWVVCWKTGLSRPNQSLLPSLSASPSWPTLPFSASVPYMVVVNCTLPPNLVVLWAAPLTLPNQWTYGQLLVLAWFGSPNVFSRFGDHLQQPTSVGSAIRNYWKVGNRLEGVGSHPYWLPIVFGFSLLKNTT